MRRSPCGRQVLVLQRCGRSNRGGHTRRCADSCLASSTLAKMAAGTTVATDGDASQRRDRGGHTRRRADSCLASSTLARQLAQPWRWRCFAKKNPRRPHPTLCCLASSTLAETWQLAQPWLQMEMLHKDVGGVVLQTAIGSGRGRYRSSIARGVLRCGAKKDVAQSCAHPALKMGCGQPS